MHATTLDGAVEVAIGADAPVTPASTIKVLVAIEAAARFADGRLDPAMPVHLGEPQRTVGPVGLSLFTDDATISARDLLVLMLTISDNVATDALIGMLGIETLNAAAEHLGMTATVLPSDLRAMLDRVAAAAGFSSYAEIDALDESDSRADRRDRRSAAPGSGSRPGHRYADVCTRHDHAPAGDLGWRRRTGGRLRPRALRRDPPSQPSTDREWVRARREGGRPRAAPSWESFATRSASSASLQSRPTPSLSSHAPPRAAPIRATWTPRSARPQHSRSRRCVARTWRSRS